MKIRSNWSIILVSKKIYEDQYKGLQLNSPDMVTHVKIIWCVQRGRKEISHAKVTTDDANLSYDYFNRHEIDKEKHTITFSKHRLS